MSSRRARRGGGAGLSGEQAKSAVDAVFDAIAGELAVIDITPLQALAVDALGPRDRRVVKHMRLRARFQQRRIMLPGVTQTLVAQRRDRREHADRLPVRLTTIRHTAEATSRHHARSRAAPQVMS